MQYKFFTVRVFGNDSERTAEEMNSFIRGHRVLNVQREFLNAGEQSSWCCCVEYIESGTADMTKTGTRTKIDYRQVLDEPSFERFRIFRECRKILAEEDAVPPFAVFLDEHLAELAKTGEITLEALKKIPGIGEKKSEKYGKHFIELWEKLRNEKSRQSISSNSGTKQS